MSIIDLMNAVNRTRDENPINETYYTLPISNSDRKKLSTMLNNIKAADNAFRTNPERLTIYVRLNIEVDPGDSDNSKHACSVKYKTANSRSDNGSKVIVPTKAYSTFKDNSKAMLSIKELKNDDKLTKKEINGIKSFIYDNQMAIIAYWYSGSTNNSKLQMAIRKYILQKIIENDYMSTNFDAKTQPELEQDKKEITDYVRNEMQDHTIELYFGA